MNNSTPVMEADKELPNIIFLEKILRDFGRKVQHLETSGEWTLTDFDYLVQETETALIVWRDKQIKAARIDDLQHLEIDGDCTIFLTSTQEWVKPTEYISARLQELTKEEGAL